MRHLSNPALARTLARTLAGSFVVALLGGVTALPSLAASSASSAVSDSFTTSSGSVSDSFGKSSDSSSKNEKKVTDGDYRIIEMAAVPERPGTARLTLQAVAAERRADDEFFLYLPLAVVEQTRLAQGDVVSARQRPYGVEFAQATTRQAFFLVLKDEWFRELQTTPVVL